MLRRASITIFASLILGVMTLLAVTCFLSVRMAAARTQILDGIHTGLYSVFGCFDRTLLDRFEIFGLNGGENGYLDLAGVCSLVRDYMEPVLLQNSQELDLLHGGLTGYRLLTDENGEPFFRQVVQYEEEAPDEDGILSSLQRLQDKTFQAGEAMRRAEEEEDMDWFSQYHRTMEEAERESRELLMAEEDDLGSLFDPYEEPPPIEFTPVENPVSAIESLCEAGPEAILYPGLRLPVPAPSGSGELLSERTPETGLYIPDSHLPDTSSVSLLYLHKYIREKLGSYLRPAAAAPACQMEYILEGEKDDQENMRRVADRLFRLRLGMDLLEFDEDAGRRAAVSELADRICSVYVIPPDREIIENTLVFCWVWAESLAEVSCLLSGGSVPLEEGNTWIVPFDGLYYLTEYLWRTGGSGEGYEDYLSLFLLDRTKGSLLAGTMDSVESSIRAAGKPGFCLDHCMTELEMAADVRANGIKTFTVTKAYGYDG